MDALGQLSFDPASVSNSEYVLVILFHYGMLMRK